MDVAIGSGPLIANVRGRRLQLGELVCGQARVLVDDAVFADLIHDSGARGLQLDFLEDPHLPGFKSMNLAVLDGLVFAGGALDIFGTIQTKARHVVGLKTDNAEVLVCVIIDQAGLDLLLHLVETVINNEIKLNQIIKN